MLKQLIKEVFMRFILVLIAMALFSSSLLAKPEIMSCASLNKSSLLFNFSKWQIFGKKENVQELLELDSNQIEWRQRSFYYLVEADEKCHIKGIKSVVKDEDGACRSLGPIEKILKMDLSYENGYVYFKNEQVKRFLSSQCYGSKVKVEGFKGTQGCEFKAYAIKNNIKTNQVVKAIENMKLKQTGLFSGDVIAMDLNLGKMNEKLDLNTAFCDNDK